MFLPLIWNLFHSVNRKPSEDSAFIQWIKPGA